MTNEAIQNREPFLQNLREKLGVEKQPVSAHPFEPVNHLPEEQLADKTPAELLTCGNDSHELSGNHTRKFTDDDSANCC